MQTGPDISRWQGPASGINFRAVRAAGHDFVIVKATQGTGYVNPYFRATVAAARAAGLAVGAYHYLDGYGNGSEQARHFVEVAASMIHKVGDLPLWLDYEEKCDHHTLDRARSALTGSGWRVGTYTYPDWWRNHGSSSCPSCAASPLWWADYNAAHNRPAPAPWRHVALRQTHGTSYRVPGLPGLQDMSRVEEPGGLATLLGGHSQPPPQVHPGPTLTDAQTEAVLSRLDIVRRGSDDKKIPGTPVKNVQMLLIGHGYLPWDRKNADGVFGPATDAAVKKLQHDNGIPTTGVVDAATWYRLNA